MKNVSVLFTARKQEKVSLKDLANQVLKAGKNQFLTLQTKFEDLQRGKILRRINGVINQKGQHQTFPIVIDMPTNEHGQGWFKAERRYSPNVDTMGAFNLIAKELRAGGFVVKTKLQAAKGRYPKAVITVFGVKA